MGRLEAGFTSAEKNLLMEAEKGGPLSLPAGPQGAQRTSSSLSSGSCAVVAVVGELQVQVVGDGVGDLVDVDHEYARAKRGPST